MLGWMNEAAYRAAEQRLWRSIGVEPVERWLHLRRNDVDVRVQEVGEGHRRCSSMVPPQVASAGRGSSPASPGFAAWSSTGPGQD